uniref:Putative secreted protein n=1 Tax=Ixodes ricinus TaxID=34613 RepID=A0A6B0UUS7_IXORI
MCACRRESVECTAIIVLVVSSTLAQHADIYLPLPSALNRKQSSPFLLFTNILSLHWLVICHYGSALNVVQFFHRKKFQTSKISTTALQLYFLFVQLYTMHTESVPNKQKHTQKRGTKRKQTNRHAFLICPYKHKLVLPPNAIQKS